MTFEKSLKLYEYETRKEYYIIKNNLHFKQKTNPTDVKKNLISGTNTIYSKMKKYDMKELLLFYILQILKIIQLRKSFAAPVPKMLKNIKYIGVNVSEFASPMQRKSFTHIVEFIASLSTVEAYFKFVHTRGKVHKDDDRISQLSS